MPNRKCCITRCTSVEGQEKDAGVTFHRFPHNVVHVEKWLKVCKLESNFKPTKNTYVCSRHFKRENFASQASGKFVLKCLSVPSIFPWNKNTIVTPKNNNSPATSKPSSPPQSSSNRSSVEAAKESSKVNQADSGSDKKGEDISATPTSEKNTSSKKKNISPKKSSPEKTKKSKRLSAKIALKIKAENLPPATPEKVKETPIDGTPKKKNQILNFVPGSTIEAQNFDEKWIQVKVIEVDMDEREVLVRSCDKTNKSKTGINDEWISMDSPRLRPAQPIVTFEIGEKVLARWNDCRKFPATIKRILDNDTYDVLFDDGYPKIVRGIHINKYSAKNQPKTQTQETTVPVVINPLLLNPPSLIPDYIKEMKDIRKAPTEGEWCCTWVDDIPVGQESSFDGPHGKLPSIIVPDWRVKEGWQKHIYLRQNGKWDVLFISPTNRKLRFKSELKNYLLEIGEIYDPEAWDFSLQKKRSKLLGLCVVTNNFKNQMLSSSFDVQTENSNASQIYNNPFASLGALPYVQPNLIFPPPMQTTVRVGALQVKVVDNIYQCPQEGCDKTFRKENHLQLHIKHYHEDLAKLMGECLNMEDLAYLRTTVDEPEIAPTKPTRKSHGPKLRPESMKEVNISIERYSPADSKFHMQRSPILEEALKAPIVTNNSSVSTSNGNKGEKDEVDIEQSSDLMSYNSFDPETLIPPYAVSKPGHVRFGGNRKRLRAKFNTKMKKQGTKKRRMETYATEDEILSPHSTVQGIIPYHEGPYFKNQSSYVDENGEVIKIVRMKKEEIINCICGYGEEDGLMVQCELCLCWQHGLCNNIEKPNQVPENYVCFICKNPHRQRVSQKYIHDQEWLYDGKLPIANYHISNPKQPSRFETLKQCHTLIGNLKEMKRFMNSLDVKINIAEKQGHPKLYLWAKKWEQSPPRPSNNENDSKDDVKGDIKMEEGEQSSLILPMIPEPEVAIEPAKCQQTLLDHIQFQQKSVKSRLETIDDEITALEEASTSKLNGKVNIDDARMKQTVHMLIKDLMKMNEISSIHRN
ncbi:CLUMA_CG009625, isoform A [Clunio marinus]|uniref:CLUMA_CG009625, isoform A n=1 Tax=Clunio marinus TaxID=568069 RepID=A0A1J1I9E7_9DIPT|nr:CLUMA_CG009625, isoform A [Clunio marinus]